MPSSAIEINKAPIISTTKSSNTFSIFKAPQPRQIITFSIGPISTYCRGNKSIHIYMYLREAVRRFIRSYSSRVRSIPALYKTSKAELRKLPRRKLTQDIKTNDRQLSFSLIGVVKGKKR